MEHPVVVQSHNARHGNFIQCTPAIQAIASVVNHPVEVFFADESCAAMVMNAPFIRRVSKAPPPGRILFKSDEIQTRMPDHVNLFRKYAVGRYGYKGAMPHTYVDRPELEQYVDVPPELFRGEYVAIVRGAGSERWHKKKDPGDTIYRHIMSILINAEVRVVLVGGPDDKRWWLDKMRRWFPGMVMDESRDDIRRAMALLARARAVIANDTGLYHAAGALDKRCFILWKDTHFKKNLSPGHHIRYSMRGSWKTEFAEWINAADEVADRTSPTTEG